MDREQIEAVARQLRIAPHALDQVVARVRDHFGEAQVKPKDLETYLGGLYTWEKAGMSYERFEKLHPNARRQLHEAFNPTPPPAVHSRRPVTRTLTTEELATLEAEGLTGAAYVEKARQMQQTPLPTQP